MPRGAAVLSVIALLLEGVGIYLAITGLVKTWKTYAPELPLFAPEARALGRLGELLGIRPPRRAVTGVAAMAATATVTAGGVVVEASLPSIVDTPEAFAAEVARRLRALGERENELGDSLAAETKARNEAIAEARAEIQDVRAERRGGRAKWRRGTFVASSMA